MSSYQDSLSSQRKEVYHLHKVLRDAETNENYIDRVEKGDNPINTCGNHWTTRGLGQLQIVLDRKATQLEIAAEMPVRTCEAI